MNMLDRKRVHGFLRTQGRITVNGDGEEVLLCGWGAGNWNNPEGFMVGGVETFSDPSALLADYAPARMLDRGRSMHTAIVETCGSEYAAAFWPRWFRNHLADEDIQAMAEAGFNSVRLPLSARTLLFEEPGIRFNEDTFTMLDDVLDSCERHGIYALLDLHGAPGGHSALPCDDGPDNIPHLFLDEENRERALLLWEEIARRYRDRWIVAGYELLNEPISLPRWNHLVPDLLRFYDDCIARIRSVDSRHMIILGGHRFNWMVDLFDRDFDPIAHNWMIAVHRYRGAPEPATILQYAEKSEELGVPVWMGECGGSAEWLATFAGILAEYHIGINIWSWKVAPSRNPPAYACMYRLPDDWELIREYARGGAKPGYEKSRRIWDEVLENIRYVNCMLNQELHPFILRRPPFTLPAVSYDALPAGSKPSLPAGSKPSLPTGSRPALPTGSRPALPKEEPAFHGRHAYGNLFGFRLGDGMRVIYDPLLSKPDQSPMGAIFSSGGPRHEDTWPHLCLALREGEHVSYSLHEVRTSCTVRMDFVAGADAEGVLEAGGITIVWSCAAGLESMALGKIPAGAQIAVRLRVVRGSLIIRRIHFA